MAPRPPANDAGPLDAAPCPECPDTGPVVVRRDAGRDTGTLTPVDSGPPTDGGPSVDAGLDLAVVVDGLLDDARWAAETPLVATITPAEPFASDHLDALYYFRDSTNLYLGITGGLAGGDHLVVYVDLGITDRDVTLMGTGLGDNTGLVDATLSIPIFGTAEFAPELGWGTATMPQALSAGSATIGWRTLAATGAFALLTTATRSACSASACETAIALSAMGAGPTTPINLVVRIGRADLGWSNQTFPTSQSSMPETIDVAIAVPAAP